MPGTPEYKPETVIAFDFGLRRIGVAVGQQVTRSASAIGVIANSTTGPDWQGIDRIIAEQEEAIMRRLMLVLQGVQDKLRVKDMETAAWLVGWIIKEVMFSAHRANLKADNPQLLDELADLVSRYLFA